MPGSIEELLQHPTLGYLLLDIHSSPTGIEVIDLIRRARPSIRPMVIGPEGNDELVLESIVAGARAYLDLNADAEAVRDAILTVTAGSIWAPRRLLSKLIDRLLKDSRCQPDQRQPTPDGSRASGAGMHYARLQQSRDRPAFGD